MHIPIFPRKLQRGTRKHTIRRKHMIRELSVHSAQLFFGVILLPRENETRTTFPGEAGGGGRGGADSRSFCFRAKHD